MDNHSTKAARGGDGVYNLVDGYSNIRFGIVKALESDLGAKDTGLGRIKVYIKGPISTGGDGNSPTEANDPESINRLPWCFPLLPKHLQAQPKVGEVVWIFTIGKNVQHADRLYIGPIISQLDKLNFDNGRTTALAGFSFGPITPKMNVASIPELKGVFPDYEDISIQGRFNTDITQKNNEIILRAGKFESSPTNKNNPFSFKFNARTQAYIQIKNDVTISAPDSETKDKGSVTNIVANKINLITHKEGSPRFNVTDQNGLISDDELAKILDEAHQVPFGDVLIEYLKLLKEALFAHVHNGNGNPSTDLASYGNKQALATFKSKAEDLEKSMLSKNIRIN
jgi:hypothetical protein